MTELSIVIERPIEEVWNFIADIESHQDWMADAESLVCVSEKKNAVGSIYHCKTVAGPFKTMDIMTVTQYVAPTTMAMSHNGAVSGIGIFELTEIDEDTTKFVWREELKFPIYMGANVGKFFAMKILHSIWKKNLQKLKFEIENGK
jgi:uncharacterized membrane protein